MKAERWQQVKEVLHSALERKAEQRAAFLAQACGGDALLRQEVESLLRSYEAAGTLFERPALEVMAQAMADEQVTAPAEVGGLDGGGSVGRYKVVAKLGSGGMGEVYLAEDRELGRQVALKMLTAQLTGGEAHVRRFLQEARSASALNHPNILTIYEFGQAGGRHYIVTEFIDGQTLRERMAGGRMKLAEALEVGSQVASALSAAHAVGIVHRDIKPENIMVRRDGIVKILDFGLAKLIDTQISRHGSDPEAARGAVVNTDSGVVMGTARYMSPEQARGLKLDARTDIWSLGVVLYEMVTGHAPFGGPTNSDLIVSILEREPPLLTHYNPQVPTELQRVVKKALRKEREERYQTAKEVALDLKNFPAATMDSPQTRLYQFGPFRLDPVRRLLWREAEAVPLKSKAFDMLLVLVEHRGKVLAKDELRGLVWPGAVVEEGTLSKNISALRRLLGESAGENRYIVTVPGRGYSFVAGVREVENETAGLMVETHTVSRRTTEEAIEQPPAEQGRQPAGLPGEGSAPPPESLVGVIKRHKRAVADVAGTLMSAAIIAGSYRWFGREKAGSEPVPRVNSIAVLPFKQLGASETDAYLGLGLADGLITRLGNLRQVQVRPTSAIIKYANSGKDSVAAGRELNVGAVLEGSIQRAGERIRVTVQLVGARDGAPLWTGTFDENFIDIFRVEDEISEHIAEALMLSLTGPERQQLKKHYTKDSEAFQLYLKGRYYWSKRAPEQIKKGIGFFEQAVKKDPDFALAYAGLADSYAVSSSGLQPKERLPLAKAAALKALELDDSLAEAHTSLAFVKYKFDWDWGGSEQSFKRAIEINPHYAQARHWYGEFLGLMGRFGEGLAELKSAQDLDPLSAAIKADTGVTLYRARRYDEAIEECRSALDLDPHFWVPHRYLAWAYEQKGMYEQAVGEDLEVRTLTGMAAEKAARLKGIYKASGWVAYWRKVLELTQAGPQPQYIQPYTVARIYVRLGDKDQAFAWLERSYENRDDGPLEIKSEPGLDNLRSDPRFTDVLRRIGLKP